jgi:hypothetical protein
MTPRERAEPYVDRLLGYTGEPEDREHDLNILEQMLTEHVRALLADDEHWAKEACIAWSVCASIHREYAKGKDALFTTRQADFVKHEEDARAAALRRKAHI